jgi:hypothetical protein
MRQNVVQNKKDYETICEKLMDIDSIIKKYQRDGSQGAQRALDHRIKELSLCVISSCSISLLTGASVL